MEKEFEKEPHRYQKGHSGSKTSRQIEVNGFVNRSRRGNTANFLAGTIRERSNRDGSLPRIMESTLSPQPNHRRANLLSRQNIKSITTNPTMSKLQPAPPVQKQNYLNIKSLESLPGKNDKTFMENKNFADLRMKCGV